MIATLPCRHPTLKERLRVRRRSRAEPHRRQGLDFMQGRSQKAGGRDYDKSLFHALHGLSPSSRFTGDRSGQGQVVGQRVKVRVSLIASSCFRWTCLNLLIPCLFHPFCFVNICRAVT